LLPILFLRIHAARRRILGPGLARAENRCNGASFPTTSTIAKALGHREVPVMELVAVQE